MPHKHVKHIRNSIFIGMGSQKANGCPSTHQLYSDLSYYVDRPSRPFHRVFQEQGTDSPPSRSILGCKSPQCMLEVLAQWNQLDNIICKERRQNSVIPWLQLEILSINTMTRTSNKGQSCWSPMWTRNRSDLLLAVGISWAGPAYVLHIFELLEFFQPFFHIS